ncbi:hypothetical protein GW846_04970 [Candidatus Gracilibacteria bacterium]|nr:hypothetical protein [Candidatus Gracilibacteria bacterium]
MGEYIDREKYISIQGMVQLSKTEDFTGFDGSIVFVLPEKVGMLLLEKHQIESIPDVALLRNGVIGKKGKSLFRKQLDEPIRYCLFTYDEVHQKLRLLIDKTGQKTKNILGSSDEYLISIGGVYVSQKNYNNKKPQF